MHTGKHEIAHRMKHAEGYYIWVKESAKMLDDKVTLIGTVNGYYSAEKT